MAITDPITSYTRVASNPKKALGSGWDWAVTGMSGGHGYVPQYYPYEEDQYDPLRANEQQSREFEDYLAGQYQDQIEGKTPSLARTQLAETTAANQAQQLAMARSGSGPMGNAGQQYEAARNAAAINQASNRQAATLRAQETQMAMQGASGLAGQRRAADLGRLATEQDYQSGKAGVGASLEASRASQSESEANRRAGASMFGVGTVAGIAGGLLKSDVRAKAAPGEPSPAMPAAAPFDPEAAFVNLNANRPGYDSAGNPYQGRWDWTAQDKPAAFAPPAAPAATPYGQGAQAGGILGSVLGSLSDETSKRGPMPMRGEDMDRFLEDLEGYRYRYRHGTGEDPNRDRVGVMAQDLERDPVGQTFVTEGTDGYKRIEVDKGFGTALAALGRLNERVDAMERRGGRG